MNEIKVTTELCAEDRARLDKLTAALEQLAPITVQTDETVLNIMTEGIGPDNLAETKDHGDFVEIVTEPEEPETPATPEEPETPATPEEPAAPQHTSAEISQKVAILVSAGKKEAVKAIIKEYAAKVSAIPEDKVDEVWSKLNALEG